MIIPPLLLLAACAEMKGTGRTIGHASRDAATEIGHASRDAAIDVGHATREVATDIGHASRDAARQVAKGTQRVVEDLRAEFAE